MSGCGRVGFTASDRDASAIDAVSTNPFFDDTIVPAPVGGALIDGETFTYNTDTDMLMSASMSIAHASVIDTSREVPTRILSLTTLDVRTGLTIIGSLPLVIVAESVTVSAEITVKAGPQVCGAALGENSNGGVGSGGGGGGAGGSFGAMGGTGGVGNSDGVTAAGGTANSPSTPTLLRGGCSGAKGGDGPETDVGGDGGSAGGALLLQADTIVISGTVRAHGFGGAGGAYTGNGGDAGGGGGGSGGMLVLLSPSLTLTGATLFANGGAGGEGSLNGVPGMPGVGGIDDDVAAQSGDGNGMPEDNGGQGGHRSSPQGSAAPGGAVGGGGGGGGSVGVILLSDPAQAVAAATISPAPTPL